MLGLAGEGAAVALHTSLNLNVVLSCLSDGWGLVDDSSIDIIRRRCSLCTHNDEIQFAQALDFGSTLSTGTRDEENDEEDGSCIVAVC